MSDPLSYIATGLPAGLTIGAGTGLIAGTISAGAAIGSPYNVTVTVSDGKGGSDPDELHLDGSACMRPGRAATIPSLVGCWPMDEGSGTTAADGGALPANNVTFVGDADLGGRPERIGDQPERHDSVRHDAGRGQPGHRQPDHAGGLDQAGASTIRRI